MIKVTVIMKSGDEIYYTLTPDNWEAIQETINDDTVDAVEFIDAQMGGSKVNKSDVESYTSEELT